MSTLDVIKGTDGVAQLIIGLVTTTSPPNLRQRLQRIFFIFVAAIVVTALLAFALDFAIFRIRAAMNWNAYATVTVSHYNAVLLKNGKTQFTFDPPAPWTCVNALFPHAGSLPCWYLTKHPEQRTDI